MANKFRHAILEACFESWSMTAWFALAGKRMANPITHAHPMLVFILQCICEATPLRNCRVERLNSKSMAEGVAMLCLFVRCEASSMRP